MTRKDKFLKVEIRILPQKLLPDALALCKEVFMEFEAPGYPPEGTINFLAFLELQQMERMVSTGLLRFFGAFCGKDLIGAAALRDHFHICLLFVKKEFHRQGVGTALLSAMEKQCCSCGIRMITVNASPYGLPFYLARGYKCRSEEECIDGIRFTPMERSL